MRLNILIACAFTLSACNTVTGPNGTKVSLISEVQSDAKTACKFIPTAGTILGIVAAGVPALSEATAVAKAICSAVSGPGKAATPMVAGVRIEGDFVKEQ